MWGLLEILSLHPSHLMYTCVLSLALKKKKKILNLIMFAASRFPNMVTLTSFRDQDLLSLGHFAAYSRPPSSLPRPQFEAGTSVSGWSGS